MLCATLPFSFFFFNDTATTEIYTLSLHDALPISRHRAPGGVAGAPRPLADPAEDASAGNSSACDGGEPDRKSTRLNSSHLVISYAVFCLKKKKKIIAHTHSHHLACLPRSQHSLDG